MDGCCEILLRIEATPRKTKCSSIPCVACLPNAQRASSRSSAGVSAAGTLNLLLLKRSNARNRKAREDDAKHRFYSTSALNSESPSNAEQPRCGDATDDQPSRSSAAATRCLRDSATFVGQAAAALSTEFLPFDGTNSTIRTEMDDSSNSRIKMLLQLRDLRLPSETEKSTSRNNKKNRLSATASEAIERLSNHGGFNFGVGVNSDFGMDGETTCREEFKLGDPIHDDYFAMGRFRNKCGALINQPVSHAVSSLLILLNAGVLAALTFRFENPKVVDGLEILDMIILSLFTIELFVQAFYLGISAFLANRWFLLDLIIIIFSWSFLGSSINVLRSLRIFRVFALLSRWESMRHLVQAVGTTLPRMASIWATLLLFFFVFCVLFTDLYGDLYEDDYLDYDYFGRLDKTFLTLFQFMTLDSWSGVVRQVLEGRPAALISFCSWIVITAFFMLNLVVAVICDSLIELNNLKEKKLQNNAMKKHQNMITAQTEELLQETQRLTQIQSQLLQNQVLMQQALLQMAHLDEANSTPKSGVDDGSSNVRNGDQLSESTGGQKGALGRLLSNMSDDEGSVESKSSLR